MMLQPFPPRAAEVLDAILLIYQKLIQSLPTRQPLFLCLLVALISL